MTFRTRLLLASLATLAAGVAALLIIGNVLLRHQVHSQTDDLLRERVTAQLAALRVHGNRITVSEPPNDEALDRQAWIFGGTGVVERPAGVSARVDAAAVALGTGAASGGSRSAAGGSATGGSGGAAGGSGGAAGGSSGTGGGGSSGAARQRRVGDIELRAAPVRNPAGTRVGVVVVALSVASVERLESFVLAGSFVLAALVLLAGTVAIRRALRGALRSVEDMTAQAEAWGAHDLEHRFGLGPPRDELTGLAATLDNLLARIAASRRHEQRFAGEMAHELRTPLAGIRTRAELALDDAADDEERQAALRSVLDQTTRLTDTIDTLLAVARREVDPSASVVDLAAVAGEIEDVHVAGGPVPTAEGDPDVVRRALAPLVENARRHARSAVTLELRQRDRAVELLVRDDGPGTEDDRVFDPGFTTSDGAGLGLALSRRLAQSCGGNVRLGPGPGGCFVLELPVVRE